MNKLLAATKAVYPNYTVELYDEPWSQGEEFITFKTENNEYIGRIHYYQLLDIIKVDLLNSTDETLRETLADLT
jgi:hypothetical protein